MKNKTKTIHTQTHKCQCKISHAQWFDNWRQFWLDNWRVLSEMKMQLLHEYAVYCLMTSRKQQTLIDQLFSRAYQKELCYSTTFQRNQNFSRKIICSLYKSKSRADVMCIKKRDRNKTIHRHYNSLIICLFFNWIDFVYEVRRQLW